MLDKKWWTIVDSMGRYLINTPGKGYQYSEDSKMRFNDKSHTHETLNFFRNETQNQNLFWKEIK